MWAPIPRRSDSWLGEPKPHHVPPPGTVAQRISDRLRMYQPSSTGTRPTSVSSIFASCRMAPEPNRRAAAFCLLVLLVVRRGRAPPRPPRRSRGDVPRADGRVAAAEAVEPGGAALLRRAVVLDVAVVEVAGRRGGAHRLLDVARLKLAGAVDRVAPQAGHAVGLQLERLDAGPGRLRVEAELLLDVVRVLVRDDVGEPEVADRVAVAGALAREVARDPAPQPRGEHDRDVDRVVVRAVERGAVVGRHAAAGAQDVARLDPHASEARLGPARRREGLGPVRVDARDDLVEEALDLRRLRAPAARRRAGLWRRLGHRLLDPRQDLLDA